jgi:hypothetical protein
MNKETRHSRCLHPEILKRMNALLLEVDSSIVADIKQALLDFQPYYTPHPKEMNDG